MISGESFRFTCTSCGKCCISHEPGEAIFLYEMDILNLAQAFSIHPDDFVSTYTKHYEYHYVWPSKSIQTNRLVLPCEKDCPFLIDNLCSVYNNRPFQCRAWPFIEPMLTQMLKGLKSFIWCPGLNHGRIVPMSNIYKLVTLQHEYETQYNLQANDSSGSLFKWLHSMKPIRRFIVHCSDKGDIVNVNEGFSAV